MQDLFVSSEGRRRGIGRALIQAVYEAASEQDADRIYWQTPEINHNAIALYNDVAERSDFLFYRKMLP